MTDNFKPIGIKTILFLYKTFHTKKIEHRNENAELNFEKSINVLNLKQFKNICVVGYNEPITLKQDDQIITLIEPIYYSFFENVKNLKYINKPCYSDDKTKFSFYGIKNNEKTINFCKKENSEGLVTSTTIDNEGKYFDLICLFPNSQCYESLIGAKNNIKTCNYICIALYCWNEQIDKYLIDKKFKRSLCNVLSVLSVLYQRS